MPGRWSPDLEAFLAGGSGAENRPLGPGVAALVVLACLGRQELRAWGRRIRDWRAPTRSYLVAVLVPLTVALLVVAVNHGLGAPGPTSDQLADWPQVPVTFLVMLVFVGIGEETGWTLFAAPILLKRHGFLAAWLLAAGMRILWHLPMMLDGNLSWVLGTLGNAAFTLVTLLVFTTSGGRVVPGCGLARHAQRRRRAVLLHDGHRGRQCATRRPPQPCLRSAGRGLVRRPPAASTHRNETRREPRGPVRGVVMTATTSADAIVRQRAYDWEDPAATREAAVSQDGLTVLRAIGAGECPCPRP